MELISKKQLARAYGISSKTFWIWLKDLPELNTGRRSLLTPIEREMIFKKFGRPDRLTIAPATAKIISMF